MVDLNQIAVNSIYAKGVGKVTTQYCGKIFEQYMVEGNVLELGPAEGIMTEILYKRWKDYTVIDGAEYYIESIKKRFCDIKAYSCMFEEFEPRCQYDNIILGHVLEHVENPNQVIKLCKSG